MPACSSTRAHTTVSYLVISITVSISISIDLAYSEKRLHETHRARNVSVSTGLSCTAFKPRTSQFACACSATRTKWTTNSRVQSGLCGVQSPGWQIYQSHEATCGISHRLNLQTRASGTNRTSMILLQCLGCDLPMGNRLETLSDFSGSLFLACEPLY